MAESERKIVAGAGRPLGVSLAIILCAGLFAVLPLVQLGMNALVYARLSSVADVTLVMPDGSVVNAIDAGGFEGLNDPWAWVVQGVVALWVLGVCVMAWRGRPRGARWWFTGTVLVLAGLSAYVTLARVLAVPALTEGFSSADELTWWDGVRGVGSVVLLPLYTVWYMNRAPARAFFERAARRGTVDVAGD